MGFQFPAQRDCGDFFSSLFAAIEPMSVKLNGYI